MANIILRKTKSLLSNGLISALISTIISGSISWYLLSKQIDNTNSQETRKTRTSLIREVEGLFAPATFLESIFFENSLKSIVMENGPEVCRIAIKNKIDLKELKESCDFEKIKETVYQKDLRLLEAHIQYKSLLRIVPLYFCEKTTQSFQKLEADNTWWLNKYTSARQEILESMYEEIECK